MPSRVRDTSLTTPLQCEAASALLPEEAPFLSLASVSSAESKNAAFADVPASNPNFKYIQGLANSGFVIGIDGTHFAPQKPLTREQMIYIKACADERQDIKTNGQALSVLDSFSDGSKINKRFLGAVYEDQSASTTGTFHRVYGTTKLFQPQQAVTRTEAAEALSVMKGEWARSAAEVLGRSPSP